MVAECGAHLGLRFRSKVGEIQARHGEAEYEGFLGDLWFGGGGSPYIQKPMRTPCRQSAWRCHWRADGMETSVSASRISDSRPLSIAWEWPEPTADASYETDVPIASWSVVRFFQTMLC